MRCLGTDILLILQVKVLSDMKLSTDEDRAAYKVLSEELAAAYPENLAVPVDILKRSSSRLPDPLKDEPVTGAKGQEKTISAGSETEEKGTAAEQREKEKEGSGSSEKVLETPEEVRENCTVALAAAEEVRTCTHAPNS